MSKKDFRELCRKVIIQQIGNSRNYYGFSWTYRENYITFTIKNLENSRVKLSYSLSCYGDPLIIDNTFDDIYESLKKQLPKIYDEIVFSMEEVILENV